MNKIIITLVFSFYNFPLYSQGNTVDPDNSKMIPSFVGTIIFSKGQIIKKRQEEEINASKEGKILSKDIIKTGRASVVKMKMVDETIISLGPETEFEISKFDYKKQGDRQSIFYLSQGQIRAHFPIKAKDGDIEFKTKNTTMGIRGTTLLANVQKENEQTEYLLLEGKIDVKNLISGKSQSLVPGGHYILNRKGGTIEEKQFEADKKLLEELNATSFDEAKDLKPFLRFYEGKNKNEITRGPASISDNSDQESRIIKTHNQEKTPKWKNALKELNTQLRRNSR